MSGFLKVIGVVIMLAGIVTGIYLGDLYGTGHYGSYFNWAIFLGSVFSGIISGAFFLGLGEIVMHLSILSERADKEDSKDDQLSYEEAWASFNGVKSSPGDWACQHCGTKNPRSADSCKSCGKYK